jgi:hypothetical protein
MLKPSRTFAAACDDGARENRASSDASAPVTTFCERVRTIFASECRTEYGRLPLGIYPAYSSRERNLTNSRN